MPELPEVETIVHELIENQLIGAKIREVSVFWPRTIAEPQISDFCMRLTGQIIQQIQRRGKFIVITLNHNTLLIHLRMTGKLILRTKKVEVSRYERIRLALEDERFLSYEDQRKFGKWYLTMHPEELLNKLGLEPLSSEFTLEALQIILSQSALSIKAFLLDQRWIAGLGNIYVDEALWEAQIHPHRKSHLLIPSEIKALYRAIPKVLAQGIKHRGTSLGSHLSNYFSLNGKRGGNQAALKVFRRENLPCPRCQTSIIKIVVAQRGTHLCPACQLRYQN